MADAALVQWPRADETEVGETGIKYWGLEGSQGNLSLLKSGVWAFLGVGQMNIQTAFRPIFELHFS